MKKKIDFFLYYPTGIGDRRCTKTSLAGPFADRLDTPRPMRQVVPGGTVSAVQ